MTQTAILQNSIGQHQMPAHLMTSSSPQPWLRRSGIPGYNLMYEIDATCSMISRGKREIIFDGTGAKTDNKYIQLPLIVATAFYELDKAEILRGYANHESAHCRYTIFQFTPKLVAEVKALAKTAKEEQPIWLLFRNLENIIEDCYIERRLTQEFRGTWSHLNATRKYVTGKAIASVFKPGQPAPQINANKCLAGSLIELCNIINNWASKPDSQRLMAFFDGQYPEITALCRKYEKKISNAGHSTVCKKIAFDLLKDYLNLLDQQSEDEQTDGDDQDSDQQSDQNQKPSKSKAKKPSKSKSQQDDADGDESEDDTSSKASKPSKKSKPKKTSAQSDSSDSQDSQDQESGSDTDESQDTSDAGDASPKDDDANDPDSGDDQTSDGSDPSSDPSDSPDADEADPQDDDAQDDDQADSSDAAANASNGGTDDGSEDSDARKPLPNRQQALADDIKEEDQHQQILKQVLEDIAAESKDARDALIQIYGPQAVDVMVQAKSEIRHLPNGQLPPRKPANPLVTRAMRSMIMARHDNRIRTQCEDGDFDHHNIVGMSIGASNVFKVVTTAPKVKTALAILGDQSGSMYEVLEIVGDILSATAEACYGFADLQSAVYTYTTDDDHWDTLQFHILKDFNYTLQQAAATLAEWRRKPGALGTTPTAEAILETSRRLNQTKAVKKIIILVTDGSPNNAAATLAAYHMARQQGIICCVIEIGDHSEPLTPFDVVNVIKNLNDLPYAIQDMAKRSILLKNAR